MDPGPEGHKGPQVPLSYEQQQFLNVMLEGQHHQDDENTPEDTNMTVQEGDQEGEEDEESEASYYETDSGTDSNEDLHSGAEPHWIDVQAKGYRGCSDTCPEGVVCEDYDVLTRAGHVDLTYGDNARIRIDERYRRCVCERMIGGQMVKCETRLSAMAIRCRWKLCKKCRPDWRVIKRQAAEEVERQKESEENLLGRPMTEVELDDMLTEKEIHGITFARSRCHGRGEDILDAKTENLLDTKTEKRCRCKGCEKPLPADKELSSQVERAQRRRRYRDELKPGPTEPFDASSPHHSGAPYVWDGAPDHNASSGW